MPQMYPIYWFFLFIEFTFIFIMFNMMNYYLFYFYKPKFKNNKKLLILNSNWKW